MRKTMASWHDPSVNILLLPSAGSSSDVSTATFYPPVVEIRAATLSRLFRRRMSRGRGPFVGCLGLIALMIESGDDDEWTSGYSRVPRVDVRRPHLLSFWKDIDTVAQTCLKWKGILHLWFRWYAPATCLLH